MILYNLARRLLGLKPFVTTDYTMFVWYRISNGDVILSIKREQ